MKKLFFVVAFLTATMAASAQGWWAGGGIGYFFDKNKDTKIATHEVSIMPEAGYDFNDKWGVAMAIGYTGQYQNNKENYYEQSQDVHALMLQPYVRYKFAHIGNATFFVDGTVTYSYASVVAKNGNFWQVNDAHSVSVGLQPGFAYLFCDKAVLATRFGFLGYKYDGLAGTNGFGFDFSSYSLGLSMYFLF